MPRFLNFVKTCNIQLTLDTLETLIRSATICRKKFACTRACDPRTGSRIMEKPFRHIHPTASIISFARVPVRATPVRNNSALRPIDQFEHAELMISSLSVLGNLSASTGVHAYRRARSDFDS